MLLLNFHYIYASWTALYQYMIAVYLLFLQTMISIVRWTIYELKKLFSLVFWWAWNISTEVEHSTNPLDPWNWTIKYKTIEKTMTKVTTSIMLIFLHCNFGTRFISYFIFIFYRSENSMEYSSSSRIDVKYNDISWFIHFDISCCDIFIPFYINNW